jgi:hypothetical protein
MLFPLFLNILLHCLTQYSYTALVHATRPTNKIITTSKKNKTKHIIMEFKVMPWKNANTLLKKDDATDTPFEFMFDEPDLEQCYVKGTEVLTMAMTIREVGKYYTTKKTTLGKDWFSNMCNASNKWAQFFGELYHGGEPGSYVYFFKVTLPKNALYSVLLTNNIVPCMYEEMMNYLETTRFKEVGFSMSMNQCVGGCIGEDIDEGMEKKRKREVTS